tara:strand:- start:876 stop:1985 length:1110 start_codon:yes stop_codon:yes gene_type:complete
MKKKRIPSKTRPEAKKKLYQAALKEKMRINWKCFNSDPDIRMTCRKLLLQLIKINLIFPIYRKQFPDATMTELEEIWNGPSDSASDKSEKSSDSSPEDLILRCPRCKSNEIVIDRETAICRLCAHSWQLGGNFNVIFAARSKIQMPTIQAYIDSKGREIDPDMPKIFSQRTKKEAFLQKSIQELIEIMKSYSRKWQIEIWSSFLRHTIFMWVKYLESLPSGKGLPKKQKRMALMAVFTYYGNIMSNRELTWETIAKIFNVLPKEMDIMKKSEIMKFWSTDEGAAISAELFPLLVIRETSQKKETTTKLLDKIRRDETKATQLGLDAYLAFLEDRNFPLPEGVKRASLNKQRKVVETWFDTRPSELRALL